MLDYHLCRPYSIIVIDRQSVNDALLAAIASFADVPQVIVGRNSLRAIDKP